MKISEYINKGHRMFKKRWNVLKTMSILYILHKFPHIFFKIAIKNVVFPLVLLHFGPQ